MRAQVFRECGDWFVAFSGGYGDPDPEYAGPFDDEHDAVCAARRHANDVGLGPYAYAELD